MKLILFVLIPFIAAATHAAVSNPNVLFNRANDYQLLVTTLQQEIIDKITGMRFSLSAILKRTSNITLDQVQENLQTIFDMEQPVRIELFEGFPTMDSCIVNLRDQLNLITEMSGYESSNCIKRYDTNVTALVAEAYNVLQEYEGLISIIQMTVLDAFNDINVYTKAPEIEQRFVDEYNYQLNKWETTITVINNFLQTLENDISVYNAILGDCFLGVQNRLQPKYDNLIDEVEICREFHNL